MNGTVIRRIASAKTACLIVLLSGCAALDEGADLASEKNAAARANNLATTTWAIKTQLEGNAIFRSAQNVDGASAPHNSFLYPAPNVVGLLAAIATHALIVNSVMERQRERLRADADKRLEPYQTVLNRISTSELMAESLSRVARDPALRIRSNREETSWTIDVSPIFTISERGDAIILDNAVKYLGPDSTNRPFHQLMIRVVSEPRGAPDPVAYWTENEGAHLKEESASLLANSIRVAIENVRERTIHGQTERTFRYLEGSEEKTERATLINAECGRILIRNLRGWLISVPTPRQSPVAECRDSAPATN